jgi:formylglycine-generating enzyme required for sulfatase activity
MTTDLIGGRLGKYEIRSEIGRGGAGIVYRGYDPDLNRDVAIKVLSPLLAQNQAVVERFRREARSAAQLDHPNIVTIHDVGKDGDWHYFVMRYLEGETLTEVIRRRAPLPPEDVLSILRPLAQALDYAHSQGLVHRDVKPSNIIVGPTGHVTMTDFGIALAAFEKRITATGAIVGTPDYMSPEQVEGLEVDGRSDQYSLGIIAYEMLSGQLPFEGTGPGNLLYKIVHEKTPPIGLIKSDLPKPVGKVLEQVLAKKAKDRFVTTGYFVEVLDRAITPARASGVTGLVKRGTGPLLPRKKLSARAWIPIVAVALIVLVILLLIVLNNRPTAEMVHVPAGEFVMGSDTGESYERPTHVVHVDEFWIDRTEVTNAQFAEFVAATDYQSEVESKGGFLYGPEGRVLTPGADWQHPQGPDSDLTGLDDHPVVLVSWNDAVAYCEWRGARLPTEAEWEKAARGDDERTHPWGEGVDASKLNYCDSRCPFDWRVNDEDDGYRFTAPVGSYPPGAGPYGALDMAGNVREWVSDWYDPGYYVRSPASNPSGPSSGELKVARGSAWNDVEWTIHATDRYYYLPHFGGNEVGFRCAEGAP